MGTLRRGYDWLCKVGGSPVAFGSEKNSKLSVPRSELDASDKSISGGFGKTLSGIAKWDITTDGAFMVDDTNGWKAMVDAHIAGTEVDIELKESNSSYKFAGKAYITSFELDTPHDGLATGTLKFSGSSALTFST